MKKYLGFIIVAVIVIALLAVSYIFDDSDSNYLKDVSFTEVVDMMDKEKTFILYINQDGCEHCKAFTPTFVSVLRENKLTAYSLNLAKLSKDEEKSYSEKIKVNGTPTVLFIDNGNENLIRIEGEQTKDKIKSKLEATGFIK